MSRIHDNQHIRLQHLSMRYHRLASSPPLLGARKACSNDVSSFHLVDATDDTQASASMQRPLFFRVSFRYRLMATS